MALQFIITDAGRAAIAQVGGAIGPVTLTKIAIGSGGYTPLANRTALQTEIKRLDPSGSSVPVPGTIHLTAQDDSADSYSVKEIGLYTNNNVLFAIYSQTGVILTKGSTASALFAMDFVMTNVPAGTVVVGDAGFSYAQANEIRLGVLAIATGAEAQAGIVDTKIITPLKLAQVTATESRRGVIALANITEAQALVPDTTKALTVARLVDRTATTSRLGVVELADNTETQTGTDTARAVTPAGLKNTLVGYAAAAHTHGNISNVGAIGTTASLPIITGTNGVLQASSFGTAANTFCQGNDTRLAQATSSAAGIVELADNTETQTGTSTSLAVTPASLASRTATDARAGIVELATNAETQAGQLTNLAVTPAGLASAASLFVPPGAVMPFAMSTAPSGWVPADNRELLKTGTYAALFAAIGTLYGETNGVGAAGTSHFRVPDLRGYFVRGSGTNADGTASGTFGAKQADAFQDHGHTANVLTGNGSIPTTGATGTSYGAGSGTGNANSGNRSTETRPKNIALLYCIKI